MKGFLFDENLPQNLTFPPALPVMHARSLGAGISDTALWEYAREHRPVVVSKDADFSHRMMLAVPPPWVVHLRFGNLRRREFHAALARLWPSIEALLPEHKLVNAHLDRVEAIRG